MHVKLNYLEPPAPGEHLMQVRFTENEAERLTSAMDDTCEVIRHMATVCAHVRDLISNAAPAPVPPAAASILHMSFLALNTLSNRECETINKAESHIRLWRRKAIEEREWEEEEGARARAKKLQEAKENEA